MSNVVKLTTLRKIALSTAIVLGVLEVVGFGCWAVFASAFGGGGVKLWGGITWSMWILLFFLAGPITLLLASILANSRPLEAGIWLVLGGVASAVLAVVVMSPHPAVRELRPDP